MQFNEAEVSRRVDDVCQLLGIDHLRSRAPYSLSGGEQKKVAIACVLSMNPDAYCFDEPLNGLDQRTREWLLGFLRQLRVRARRSWWQRTTSPLPTRSRTIMCTLATTMATRTVPTSTSTASGRQHHERLRVPVSHALRVWPWLCH